MKSLDQNRATGMDEKKAMLEAALFVSDDPLSRDAIMDALNLGSPGYVQTVIDELRDDLQADNRGLEIIETEEGYQLQVKEPYIDQVKQFAPHQDLGDATLRTLSLIAYNAPVKQSRIIDIRGNRAYSQISELEDRGMIASEKDGRTKVLDVTEDFLDYFGLESIDEFRERAEGRPASEELVDEDDVSQEDDADTGDGTGTGEDQEDDDDAGTPAEEDTDDGRDAEADDDDGEDADGPTRITDPTV